MIKNIQNNYLKRKARKKQMRLDKQNCKLRKKETEVKSMKLLLRRARKTESMLKEESVTEFCAYCEASVTMYWRDEDGVIGYCPHCGAKMMICTKCDKNNNKCDYDYVTETCSEM